MLGTSQKQNPAVVGVKAPEMMLPYCTHPYVIAIPPDRRGASRVAPTDHHHQSGRDEG